MMLVMLLLHIFFLCCCCPFCRPARHVYLTYIIDKGQPVIFRLCTRTDIGHVCVDLTLNRESVYFFSFVHGVDRMATLFPHQLVQTVLSVYNHGIFHSNSSTYAHIRTAWHLNAITFMKEQLFLLELFMNARKRGRESEKANTCIFKYRNYVWFLSLRWIIKMLKWGSLMVMNYTSFCFVLGECRAQFLRSFSLAMVGEAHGDVPCGSISNPSIIHRCNINWLEGNCLLFSKIEIRTRTNLHKVFQDSIN